MSDDGVTSPFSRGHYENVARSNARTIEAGNDLSRHRSRDISLPSDLQNRSLARDMCRTFLLLLSFFFPKMQIIPVARREHASIQRGPGNKLKRMNGDTKMTFKFGRGENDRNIHMWPMYTPLAARHA